MQVLSLSQFGCKVPIALLLLCTYIRSWNQARLEIYLEYYFAVGNTSDLFASGRYMMDVNHVHWKFKNSYYYSMQHVN